MIVKETGGDFTPAPAGTHIARCFGMVSLGTQLPNNPQFNPAFKIMLMFELPDEPLSGDSGKVLTISKEFTASLSEKSNLRHDLEGWRGRSFTKEELQGFDVVQVVGHPCMLTVIHKQSAKNKTYAAITGISKLPKNTGAPAAVNDNLIYEIENGRNKVFDSLPEWVRKKITACVEWSEGQQHSPEQDVTPASDEGTNRDDIPF